MKKLSNSRKKSLIEKMLLWILTVALTLLLFPILVQTKVVKKISNNAQDASHTAKAEKILIKETYDYVIITTNSIAMLKIHGVTILNPFITHKEKMGFSVLTVTENKEISGVRSPVSGGYGKDLDERGQY